MMAESSPAEGPNIPLSIRKPTPDEEGDFTVIIPALNKAGFSNRNLGYLCKNRDGSDTSEGTIRNWAKGKGEPGYYIGRILVVTYEMYCRSLKKADAQ
jgi:hypothetical protein